MKKISKSQAIKEESIDVEEGDVITIPPHTQFDYKPTKKTLRNHIIYGSLGQLT